MAPSYKSQNCTSRNITLGFKDKNVKTYIMVSSGLMFSFHDQVVMVFNALHVVAARLYSKAVFICCQESRCDVMF